MLLVYLLVGTIAQLIDGSIGMGFGLTSASLLGLAGVTPAAASAAVHTAKIGTGIASGAAHWKLGNVDLRLTLRIGIPGAVAAGIGATFLSEVALGAAKPLTSSILLLLGVYILVRTRMPRPTARTAAGPARWFHPLLGIIAGVVDVTGGGGWGPVTTPVLLLSETSPRKVVGSVSAAELLVAISATAGFVIGIGEIDWRTAGSLMLGGMLIAPFAAKLSARIEPGKFTKVIGIGVIVLNVANLLKAGVSPVLLTGALTVLGIIGLVLTSGRRTTRTETPETADEPHTAVHEHR
jgi:uncharacterized membrane protein YfcA